MANGNIDSQELAAKVAELSADFFIYNGPINRGAVLNAIETINRMKVHDNAILLLVTNGGDPDAAFKIARYFQLRYQRFTVLIAGVCKSAGTLLAIGAHELAFTPFGELGPLDIQMTKVDRFEQMQSGLVITDALNTLEERAMELVFKTTSSLIADNQGMVSFTAATQVAIESMKAVYAPVLARLDPEEIGTRSRAMRIAQDYGKRLDAVSKNTNPDTLRLLAETYSSHSFVIDHIEAANLFRNVREATAVEKAVVLALKQFARYQGGETNFIALHAPPQVEEPEVNNDGSQSAGDPAPDVGDPQGTAGSTGVEPGGEVGRDPSDDAVEHDEADPGESPTA